MNKEELARQYADKKVEERKEYPLYDMRKRKELTSFDGYAIEQAYEDGFDKAVDMACEWLKHRGCLYIKYTEAGTGFDDERFLNDFRKAMKEEL